MMSSNQLAITGGQFTQYNYHGQKAPIDTLKDAIAPNAFHDSAARFDAPKCHPRTCVKILDEIMGRIVGQSEDTPVKPFLWLNGAAGAGKSAIAQSTIERCMERGLRLASFFFSKTDPTRNRPEPLVATLAYQLYQTFPGTEVQAEIISAISREPLIFTKQIQQQFTALVVQPLKTYLSRHKLPEHQTLFLIVIDGLDECIDRASQKAILFGLADSVRDANPYIRIFVASRPEYDITLSFGAKNLKDIHTHLSLDLGRESDAEADIKLYLSDQFEQIKDDCNSDPVFWPKLDQSWPGEEVIKKLAWKSSRQFIYAATVIRYVTSARPRRPDRRLDMVLELRPHDGDHPFAELDALYEKILESCKNIERVLEVLSLKIMERFGNWEASLYEKFLSYEEGEVGRLFCDLGALVKLTIRENSHLLWGKFKGMNLSILHASLIDYLRDEARSKKFHIDLCGKYIGRHMANVLKYLASCGPSDYGPNSYSYPATQAANFFINNVSKLSSCTIPPELRQAACSFPLKEFLAPHFVSVDTPDTDESDDDLSDDDLSYELDPDVWDLIVKFLRFLRILVLKDPTCSYIEDHHHRNLDTLMIHPLQRYFDEEALALILALFCHLGSHRFIPWCNMKMTFKTLLDDHCHPDSTFSHILYNFDSIYHQEDCYLCLTSLWNPEKNTSDPGYLTEDFSIYFDYIHRFLGSISAPSSTVYAKAAKVCFDALPLLPVPLSSWKCNAVADDTEDDPCRHLVFDDRYFAGPWTFRISWSDLSDQNTIDVGGYMDGKQSYNEKEDLSDSDKEKDLLYQHESLGALYFTLLGYLVFFLPRCGRLDALIAACKKQQTSYMERPNNPFPIRWRRLHMEVDNYLARV